jgi:hypothetical protein
VKPKINLLEKANNIIQWDKHGFCELWKRTDMGKFSLQICCALIEAMDEIDEVHESTQAITNRTKDNKAFWGAVECGEEKIIEILHRHFWSQEMTEQEEIIIWHKYPEEKPTTGNYLVYIQGACEKWIGIDDWYHVEWTHYPNDEIIAWAEQPKGWVDE